MKPGESKAVEVEMQGKVQTVYLHGILADEEYTVVTSGEKFQPCEIIGKVSSLDACECVPPLSKCYEIPNSDDCFCGYP